jgi:hypothetical protein
MGKSGKDGPGPREDKGPRGDPSDLQERDPKTPTHPQTPAASGGDVPTNPGIGGPNRAEPVHRVGLMISIAKTKVGPAEVGKIRRLAAALRCVDGVRQVDAIVWSGWDSSPERIDEPMVVRGGRQEPFRPSGVMVWMESSGKDASSRNAATLWETAKKILGDDPDGMEFNGIDSW